MRRPLIAVIGGHSRNTSESAIALAEAAGELLAQRGYGVICGGGDGIMEAACRGNQARGGTTVGILKFNDSDIANPCVDIAIATSMDVASNNVILWSSLAVIAFEGRYGTLNEIALALDFRRPLIVLGPAALLRADQISSDLFWHDTAPTRETLPGALDQMELLIERARDSPYRRKDGAG